MCAVQAKLDRSLVFITNLGRGSKLACYVQDGEIASVRERVPDVHGDFACTNFTLCTLAYNQQNLINLKNAPLLLLQRGLGMSPTDH